MRTEFTTPIEMPFEHVEFLADADLNIPARPRPPTRSPDMPSRTR
jgi:hypothetical protein